MYVLKVSTGGRWAELKYFKDQGLPGHGVPTTSTVFNNHQLKIAIRNDESLFVSPTILL